jgi:hypothetical protein
MTTALIIGGVMLIGMGMVASQLFRLKDWLDKQPAVPNPPAEADPDEADPDEADPPGFTERRGSGF